MSQPVCKGEDFSQRVTVKDYFGFWISVGMYVNEVNCMQNLRRQGWITEVVDENSEVGRIKVKIVREAGKDLDEKLSYVTDLEPSTNWCKALTEG